MDSLSSYLDQMVADPWRIEKPFSASIDAANQILFSDGTDTDAQNCLNKWLSQNQPCLFGRSAAHLGLITHCIIREPDIRQGDEHVKAKIQDARLRWNRAGMDGTSSAFVITVVSPRIASASPNVGVQAFAHKLCELYLLEEIQDNAVHMDELFLQIAASGAILRWKAGVNYFATHGDGRWWQDHRIPGGLALSINSVGHMARSGAISKLLSAHAEILGLNSEELGATPIDSLAKALTVAMQTIHGASEANSGKATWLVNASGKCPVALPPKLQPFDCHEYRGYYHTDVTLPQEFFSEDVNRPGRVEAMPLDFSYLFEQTVSNPAHDTMGTGIRIKSAFGVDSVKLSTFEPEAVSPETSPRLMQILKAIAKS